MFSSNQILRITGDTTKQLAKSIEFILEYDDKKYDSINGFREKDGVLIFGWIPKEKDGTFKRKYASEWDTVFPDTIPTNETVITEIIWSWLKKQDKQYKKIWEEENVGYWDTPTKGFEIFGYAEETMSYPFSTIFGVKPAYLEYLD